MNTLFNSALRQSTSIRKDLTTLASSPTPSPALLGQLSASLTSFSRTIDDYTTLSKSELIPEKAEKARGRITNFRSELAEYRAQLQALRSEAEERQTVTSRNELLGRRPHHAATPENPYAQVQVQAAGGGSYIQGQHTALGASQADATRESHAFREQSFMASTNAQLDEFLERGRAVLGDLGDQREMLKGTQRKLYSVANTLGISGDTIRMVERRAKQDKWIFWTCVVVFFVFCYLVLRWLRRAEKSWIGAHWVRQLGYDFGMG
ncbi:protein transport protein bos1 [Coniosporium tulheliwenetii]|uniref:Protein transport protein bos1 n=1 Tax=Coniosporium tulheliwenetii TaxID=3383036 RepID=A0ACC2YNL0_9PEZI|nr:protein transport protein bos1 [Cladosporium sp. JES 115]